MGKPGPARKRADQPCEVCGVLMHMRYPDRRFCSKTCSGQARKGQRSRWRGTLIARDMSPEEAAWLAGLFDGEGCIVWMHKDRPHQTVRLTIANTCRPLLERVVEVTGCGSIINSPHAHLKNPRHSMSWNWQTYSRNAVHLLNQMLPWLIVKREKALKALDLMNYED